MKFIEPDTGEFTLEHYSRLGFRRLDRLQENFVYGHVKPEYDQNCIFMYQSIKTA